MRHKNTPNFVPDFMAPSVFEVDFKLLKDRGIKFIAFDADSTLVHFRGTELSEETKRHIKQQRHLFDGWCVASNRLSNDLGALAESIDAGVVRANLYHRKPKKAYFKRIIEHFQAEPQEIAIIGDKLIADVLGGNRSGFTTVWVENIGPDSPWDWVLRVRAWEKRLMKQHVGLKGNK